VTQHASRLARAPLSHDQDGAFGLHLDPSRLALSSCGVEDYYWPLSIVEIIRIRDQFVQSALEHARRAIVVHPALRPVVSSAFMFLVREFIVAVQAAIVVERARADGRPIHGSAASQYVAPIAAGLSPDLRAPVAAMAAGPARPQRWKAPLRWLRGRVVDDGLERRALSWVELDRDIVAIGTGGLISRHAKRLDDRVVYLPLSTWIEPISSTPPPVSPAGVDLVRDWVDVGRRVTADAGVSLPAACTDYLERWASALIGFLEERWRRLEKPRAGLPKRLWIGPGSGPWIRLFAEAVRRQGGIVVAHDHGSGSAHIDSSLSSLIQYWVCDEFVTFTPANASALAASAYPDMLLNGDLPKFVGLGGDETTTMPRPAAFDAVKRIMYVSGSYQIDRAMFEIIPPNTMLVDWQARLLSTLRGWGYEVILKAHPETQVMPPEALISTCGVKVEMERFETVADRADLFLFDNPCSSTFAHALSRPTPVVLADLGLANFTATGRALLERRCALVPGWLDRDNRAQVDWTELRQGIERARGLTDYTFVDTLLDSSH